MQTLKIEITGNKSLEALKKLENKQLIRIIKEPELNYYTVPGDPVSDEDFKKWVEFAEELPTKSLNEAKQQWETQKTKLRKNIP